MFNFFVNLNSQNFLFTQRCDGHQSAGSFEGNAIGINSCVGVGSGKEQETRLGRQKKWVVMQLQ